MRLKKKRILSFLLCLFTALSLLLTVRAETQPGLIRVLLTRLNLTDQIEIALDGSYTLGEIAFQRGTHLKVSCASGSLIVYYEGMAWDAGKALTLTRHQADAGLENGLRFQGKYELHPGDLTLSIKNGQLRAILSAPVEEYLLGVVPYEMSDSFLLEALKAQAVAARTYALRKAGSSQDYDVVDNTNDQAYYGVKAEHKNAAQAVRETAGLCAFYQNKLAECFYSASNGGQTELVSHVWGSGDYGYLTMVEDPYDLENPDSVVLSAAIPKAPRTNAKLGALRDILLDALSEPLEARGFQGDVEITGIQSAELTTPMYRDSPSQIMTRLRLTVRVRGQKLTRQEAEEEISIFSVLSSSPPQAQETQPQERLVSAEAEIAVDLEIFPTLESALGLSINGGSNELMRIRETENAFILESRRYGHGVGMSQRGAQWMAATYQWTFQQILRFYYPGVTLKNISYSFVLPSPIARTFLATPGPAATPTPRPTLAPLLQTPGPNEYTVKVTNIGVTSYLNLRAEPNTKSAVLSQLYYGQPLLVLQEQGEWLQVKTDELTGYVMAEFVARDQ